MLESGHLAQGEQVRRFEKAVAVLLGRRGGVATSSGTSALHLALLAHGVGAGDEVLVPSYTCVALLHAIQYVGAAARIADIALPGYNLCPDAARRALGRRTRAIVVPHMFGLPADMDEITALGVPVIEDCAQALGAVYRGRPVGNRGTVAVCSFYATKVLTTGEGGMVLADSERLLDQVRDLRDYDGRATLAVRFNYKMTDLAAALGLSQLGRLEAFLGRRRALAARYTATLRSLPVGLPNAPSDRTHIFYRYVIGVPDATALSSQLRRRGIEGKPPVPRPLHRLFGQGSCPATEVAARSALSLPLYPSLTDADADAIAHIVRQELDRASVSRPVPETTRVL